MNPHRTHLDQNLSKVRRANRSSHRIGNVVAIAAVVTVALAGCSTNSTAAPTTAASATPKVALPLVVGVRNVQISQAAVYWADAKGYFKDAGLKLSLLVGQAAQPAQLVAGQSDVYFGAQGSLFGIANSGMPTATIFGLDAGVAAYVVTSNKSVKSPTDCKSMTTGVPGTVLYAWAQQLEKIYHTNWQLTELTTPAASLANVVAGRTDCANGAAAYFQSAVDTGNLRVVLNPSKTAELPKNWPTLGVENVIAGLPARLKQKAPAVERFLAAYDKALKVFLKTSPKSIANTLVAADPVDWAAVGSADVIATDIQGYKPDMAPNGGYISDKVWSKTVSFFQVGGLNFLATSPSRFSYANSIDMSYYNAAIGK